MLQDAARPLWLLASIATLTALNLASALFAPVLMALVLGVVLSPVSRRIDALGAPRALSAFLTLALMLSLVAGLLVLLEPVMTSLLAQAPIIWAELRGTIATLQSAADGLDQVSAQVSDALGDNGASSEAAPVAVPKVSDALLLAPGFAAWVMIFIGTLYFFLLSRHEVYDLIGGSALGVSTRDMLAAEREVSRYFLTITLINGAFGLLLTGALWLLDMPYFALWGFVAFLANFILYLGPSAVAVALLVGGVVAFDGPISFMPAVVFLGLNLMEGQFVTPSLVGRQMAVSPLLVFLSLVFWLWLWGPVGGIVAIPLLVWALALAKRRNTAAAQIS